MIGAEIEAHLGHFQPELKLNRFAVVDLVNAPLTSFDHKFQHDTAGWKNERFLEMSGKLDFSESLHEPGGFSFLSRDSIDLHVLKSGPARCWDLRVCSADWPSTPCASALIAASLH